MHSYPIATMTSRANPLAELLTPASNKPDKSLIRDESYKMYHGNIFSETNFERQVLDTLGVTSVLSWSFRGSFFAGHHWDLRFTRGQTAACSWLCYVAARDRISQPCYRVVACSWSRLTELSPFEAARWNLACCDMLTNHITACSRFSRCPSTINERLDLFRRFNYCLFLLGTDRGQERQLDSDDRFRE